ncbi:hypothetical protein [Undibacterium sp. Tian12W]|uniref:hypothetical protein n=1 Tax=Undibacterium sp. Tian12W TaxID=3413054 RepID=UPI003BF41ED1
MYHYTDGGLRNVWLTNGYIEHKTKYGNGVSFQDSDGLTQAICKALSHKPGKLTGAEFRYIRSSMLLSQKSLGKTLGYSEQAVAKWEKNGKIPKAVEFFIRSLYLAKHNGNAKVCSMIDVLNLIDRIANTKIIVSEARNKWVSKFEDQELEAA